VRLANARDHAATDLMPLHRSMGVAICPPDATDAMLVPARPALARSLYAAMRQPGIQVGHDLEYHARIFGPCYSTHMNYRTRLFLTVLTFFPSL